MLRKEQATNTSDGQTLQALEGPSKGQLCRQLEAVVLVDDQLQNVMDAVAHGALP